MTHQQWQIYTSPRMIEYFRSALNTEDEELISSIGKSSRVDEFSDDQEWMDLPLEICENFTRGKQVEYLPSYAVDEDLSKHPEIYEMLFHKVRLQLTKEGYAMMTTISTNPEFVKTRVKPLKSD